MPTNAVVSIEMIKGSFSDNNGIGNFAELEFFNVVVNPNDKPGPIAQLSGPANGGAIDVLSINAKRYIDITFVSQDGTAINKATIVDGQPEFKLVGTGIDQLLTDPTTGAPIISGTPLLISGFEADATSVTYRYFLKEKPATTTTTMPTTGTGTATTQPVATTRIFKAGTVTVVFLEDAFRTQAGTRNIVGVKQSFTVDPSAPGATKAPDATLINLGPLQLEGPTIGIEDVGFKDGLLMLTIGIGVNRATLAFGGGSSNTTGQSSQQQSSGITAELLGVLGTFDIGIDAFGLLSGNFRVDVPGKFGLRIGALEVDVPDVVNITASGINLTYDPDYAENNPDGPPQEILVIDAATIKFPKFDLQGKIEPFERDDGTIIPGLVVRTNGFSLGTAELRYGGVSPTATSTAPGATSTNQPAIKIGNIIEFDDIRIGVNDFTVNFDSENPVVFDGSIYIATGGARFLPGVEGELPRHRRPRRDRPRARRPLLPAKVGTDRGVSLLVQPRAGHRDAGRPARSDRAHAPHPAGEAPDREERPRARCDHLRRRRRHRAPRRPGDRGRARERAPVHDRRLPRPRRRGGVQPPLRELPPRRRIPRLPVPPGRGRRRDHPCRGEARRDPRRCLIRAEA